MHYNYQQVANAAMDPMFIFSFPISFMIIK